MKTYRIIYRDSDGGRRTEYGTFTTAGLAARIKELEKGGCQNIIVTAMP